LVLIGDQRIEDQRVRLRAIELVDDDIARELSQRGEASVATVRCGETDATKARDVERIVETVVGLGVEQQV
jgi:hypothetical protein